MKIITTSLLPRNLNHDAFEEQTGIFDPKIKTELYTKYCTYLNTYQK